MIFYGLKNWTSNSLVDFREAAALCSERRVDFIELYHNPAEPLDYAKLGVIKGCAVTIHNTHSYGWHEFELGEDQWAMWKNTVALADFFGSDVIVVHPGQARSLGALVAVKEKLADARVIMENMSGLDLYGRNVFARTLAELEQVKTVWPVCFDFEKAVKSACWQGIDHRQFIDDCLDRLQPEYFHISGGDKDSPIDEHKNLWEATFDCGWIARRLAEYAAGRDVRLVFETPKQDGLANDLKNIDFFRALLKA